MAKQYPTREQYPTWNHRHSWDAFTSLKRQLKPFHCTCTSNNKQAAYLDKLVSGCDGENVILQVDCFSKNATIASQREIQSAHWSHGQATIFTAHSWIDTDSRESITIISDDLNHSKQSAYTYMQYIFNHLKSKCPNIKVLSIFSYGSTSSSRFSLVSKPIRKRRKGLGTLLSTTVTARNAIKYNHMVSSYN